MKSEEEIANSHQYLTFNLGGEIFAFDINSIREVIDYADITRVPRLADHLCGVINLRGNVVSVMDLRLKLGMEATIKTEEVCIVVVEIDLEGEMVQMGVLADSVREVIYLNPSNIDRPPKMGTRLHSKYIRGIGRYKDDYLIILHIDRILALDDNVRSSGEPEDGSKKIE